MSDVAGPAEIDLVGGLEDYVLPFQLDAAGARGRLVRLSGAVDEILTKHAYPDAVSSLLGEAVTLAGLLGAALKFEGKFILQTSSDGPVSLVVAHYDAPGALRGYASFDAEALPKAGNGAAAGARLLGAGHLAMTIDQGAGMERYQGLVSLDGADLTGAAHTYFRQSEQIPTLIRIAVGRSYTAPAAGERQGRSRWHAAGLMVQKLPEAGPQTAPEDGLAGEGEDWSRVAALAATVEDHELLDLALPPERLLYRLFHEEGVRGFSAQKLAAQCTCSPERIEAILRNFTAEEREAMLEDGEIRATCEFCDATYRFAAADFG